MLRVYCGDRKLLARGFLRKAQMLALCTEFALHTDTPRPATQARVDRINEEIRTACRELRARARDGSRPPPQTGSVSLRGGSGLAITTPSGDGEDVEEEGGEERERSLSRGSRHATVRESVSTHRDTSH